MANSSYSQDKLFCINFTRWKRNHIKAFLVSDQTLVFISSASQAKKKGFNSSSRLITWASKDQNEVDKLIGTFDVSPWYVEDGFIVLRA